MDSPTKPKNKASYKKAHNPAVGDGVYRDDVEAAAVVVAKPLRLMETSYDLEQQRNDGQDQSDCVTCCLATFMFGLIGSCSVCLFNCGLPGYQYPTPGAWQGFIVGLALIFFLLIILSFANSGYYMLAGLQLLIRW